MTTDSETTEQYLTFVRSRFLISVLVFVSRDFELGRVSVQFANAFAIAITFTRWRRRSEATVSPIRDFSVYFFHYPCDFGTCGRINSKLTACQFLIHTLIKPLLREGKVNPGTAVRMYSMCHRLWFS